MFSPPDCARTNTCFSGRLFEHGDAHFNGNWRCMNGMWREQQTVEEAVKLAVEQLLVWNEECPAIPGDKRHMMYPLFAAWIVLLSEDSAPIEATLSDIKKALVSYDWEDLSYSAFFVGENIYGELGAQGRLNG